MRAETTLGDVLVHAGLSREEMELGAAVTKFLKSGGTQAAAHAVVDAAAERTPGTGHSVSVANRDPPKLAPTRQPVEDGGAMLPLPVTGLQSGAAPSSFHRGGEGPLSIAPKRQTRDALPVREPSAAQRRADLDMRKLVRLTILDTHRIRDGRPIGDVRYGEIETLRTANAMEASLFRQIQKKIGYADHDARLRDLVSAEELNAMKQKAAEVSDAM